MRISNCDQGSHEWEELRCGRPTASRFASIVTPARGELSKSSDAYLCELVAQSMGVYIEPPPTFWMERGVELEPQAVACYESLNNIKTQKIGFCTPDETDAYGCSPDRLIGDDGLLEVKCPKVETLIKYHFDGVFPVEYKTQVQGQLLVTGRDWCDFFAFDPSFAPFHIRVERDEKYIGKLESALYTFCTRLEEFRAKVQGMKPPVEMILDFEGSEVVQL